MDPQDLIRMLENRITYNTQQRNAAFDRGDVNTVQFFDNDTAKSRQSLDVLRESLQG